MRRKKKSSVITKSHIKYFSDLFMAAMVIAWLVVLTIMIGAAIYSMIVLRDTSTWMYVENLTAIPLSCGGALWMIKNSVQHAIINSKDKLAPPDFPSVNAEGQDEIIEKEKVMG